MSTTGRARSGPQSAGFFREMAGCQDSAARAVGHQVEARPCQGSYVRRYGMAHCTVRMEAKVVPMQSVQTEFIGPVLAQIASI